MLILCKSIFTIVIIKVNITLGGNINNITSDAPAAVKRIKFDNRVGKFIKNKSPIEFPGHNSVALPKITQKWEAYYDCLRNVFEHESERKPTVIRIMEGQYTSLKCPHCRRPFQEDENLTWKYKPLSSDINDPTEPEVLDLTAQMAFTHRKSLNIYNAFIGYSGLYVCFHGSDPISVYILEVTKGEKLAEQLNVLPEINNTISLSDGTSLEIYYQWSKWTECSTCNAVGKKYRYGTCMAKIQGPSKSAEGLYNAANHLTGTFQVEKDVQKLSMFSRIRKRRKTSAILSPFSAKEIDLAKEVIYKFHNGIPCDSNLMPNPFISDIRKLNKAEAAVKEYCKVPCSGSEIFEAIDNEGNVIETANNSAGIYSIYQAIPRIPPQVERRTVTITFGEDIILQCPGNLNTDTPVTWMIENFILVPEVVSNESQGRIVVDLLNRLHINHVRLKDSHIYSCWQRDKLAGTVMLNIDKKLKFSFDHHMMLLSMLLIILTFLFVGINILSREIKKRKK